MTHVYIVTGESLAERQKVFSSYAKAFEFCSSYMTERCFYNRQAREALCKIDSSSPADNFIFWLSKKEDYSFDDKGFKFSKNDDYELYIEETELL